MTPTSRDVSGLGIEFGPEAVAATSRFSLLTKLTKPVGKLLGLFKRRRALSLGATPSHMRIYQRSGPASTADFQRLCKTIDDGAILNFCRQFNSTPPIRILPEGGA
jgi:hypothetical protein